MQIKNQSLGYFSYGGKGWGATNRAYSGIFSSCSFSFYSHCFFLWRLLFPVSCANVSFQSSDISVFEVNIRFIGGLLSCYALTGDQVWYYLKSFSFPSSINFSLHCLFEGYVYKFACLALSLY